MKVTILLYCNASIKKKSQQFIFFISKTILIIISQIPEPNDTVARKQASIANGSLVLLPGTTTTPLTTTTTI